MDRPENGDARTLGATKLALYRTVVIPAIFPELRATILLSLGVGWATVIGAEYLGAQSGLGYILVYSQQYGYVDRMFFVALLFILYASVSYAAFNALSARLTAWAPRATVLPISSRWACMAWVLAKGMARAAPTPRAGQMAPNR